MAKPSIFISHSAKDDFAIQVRDTLYAKLVEMGFDVLMDKERLEIGTAWRKMIREWIQQCNAAIILFSKDALDSPWVLFEATTLLTRREEEQTFDVLPVRFTSVSREELDKSRYAPLVISDFQAVTGDTLDAIINPLLEQLAPLKNIYTEGPLSQFENRISLWLKKDCDREVLREVASTLGLDTDKLPLNVNYRRRLLTRELMQAEGSVMIKALKVLAPSPCVSKEDIVGMVKILTALWIDDKAVKPIPEVVRRSSSQRAVCVNGCKQITGRMYVLRASSDYPGWQVLTINAEVVEAVKAGQLDSGGMVKQIRQAYKEMMKDDEMEDDDIDRQLSSFGEDPYIVLVSGYLPEELLLALQQRYPAITFFLLEKDDDLDLQRLQANGIEFLFPKLERAQELNAYDLYTKALSIARASKSA